MDNTQEGFIAQLVIILIAVLAIGVGIFYLKNNQIPPLSVSIQTGGVVNHSSQKVNWKTHVIPSLNIEIGTPAEYNNEKGSFVFNSNNGSFSIFIHEKGSVSCPSQLCDEKSPVTQIINGVKWEYFHQNAVCLDGFCGHPSNVYRTTKYETQYYISFSNVENEEMIMNTFRFLGPLPKNKG